MSTGDLSEKAGKLKRLVDAGLHCAKLADVTVDLTSSLASAKRGLGAVATCTVSLLLKSRGWESVNPDTIKKPDSKAAKLYGNLKVNKDFVSDNGLEIPPILAARMSDKIALADKKGS